uniref:Uncharacterized protein n=1 Tax=Oncorhynchus tshawytscha TaxID=74940 RepID=A0AAZ3S948_ONCTS
ASPYTPHTYLVVVALVIMHVQYAIELRVSPQAEGGLSPQAGYRPGGSTMTDRPGGSTMTDRPGGSTMTDRPGGSTMTDRPGGSR